MIWSVPDLAWAAGLFEGEGCISILSNGLSPSFSISMTDEDVIQRFSEVMVVGARRLGNISIYPSKKGGKTSYVWSARSFAHVQQSVALLWRWFGERRQARAIEVLQEAARHTNRGRASWTHCANGHALTPENVYVPPNRPKSRRCRLCGGYRVSVSLERQFEVAA